MGEIYRLRRKALLERQINNALHTNASVRKGTGKKWLLHPIASIIVGFVLTGILGSYLSTQFQYDMQKRQRALQQQQQDYDLALRSIESFTNLIYSRRTYAVMLQSALLRNASLLEVTQRKRDYDISYIQYNSKLQTALFGIRRATGAMSYSPFEKVCETDLRRPFSLLDECLTEAYDVRTGVKASSSLTCDIDNLLRIALNCSYAVSNELYEYAMQNREDLAQNSDEALVAAQKEISRQCDTSSISVVRKTEAGSITNTLNQ